MKNLFLILLSSIILFSCKSNENNAELEDKQTKEELKNKKEFKNAVKYISVKDTVEAYFSIPDGEGPFPALILIHEQWGLIDWIRKNADEFAERGYAALAVDLYRGKSTSNFDEAKKLMSLLSNDRVIQDLKAAYEFLQKNYKVNKEKIGVIGWGMGGGYALQSAIFLPMIKAVVINYGNLIIDPANIRKINCPVLGIFGETDRSIQLIDVQNFEQALKDAKKENKIIIYRNVGHAFMNPNNAENYNSNIAERARREIFAFLEKQLITK